MDELTVERVAKATWLIENRLPNGKRRPASAWRDLATSIKDRERERCRAANALLKARLALLRRA